MGIFYIPKILGEEAERGETPLQPMVTTGEPGNYKAVKKSQVINRYKHPGQFSGSNRLV